MKDYKELWQEFYDQYIEAGLDENEAGIRANLDTGNYYAEMAEWKDERR